MPIRQHKRISRVLVSFSALALVAALLPAQQPAAKIAQAQPAARHALDMAPVKPESVGFSSERLERLHALMQQTVDQKQLAGVVTILARHGKVVDYRTYGVRDMPSGLKIWSRMKSGSD